VEEADPFAQGRLAEDELRQIAGAFEQPVIS